MSKQFQQPKKGRGIPKAAPARSRVAKVTVGQTEKSGASSSSSSADDAVAVKPRNHRSRKVRAKKTNTSPSKSQSLPEVDYESKHPSSDDDDLVPNTNRDEPILSPRSLSVPPAARKRVEGRRRAQTPPPSGRRKMSTRQATNAASLADQFRAMVAQQLGARDAARDLRRAQLDATQAPQSNLPPAPTLGSAAGWTTSVSSAVVAMCQPLLGVAGPAVPIAAAAPQPPPLVVQVGALQIDHDPRRVYVKKSCDYRWTAVPALATCASSWWGPVGLVTSAVLSCTATALSDMCSSAIATITPASLDPIAKYAVLRGKFARMSAVQLAGLRARYPKALSKLGFADSRVGGVSANPPEVDRADFVRISRTISSQQQIVSWLKRMLVDALMVVGGISKIAVPVAYWRCDVQGEIRAAHVRSNKGIEDDHLLISYGVWTREGCQVIISSPDLVTYLKLQGNKMVSAGRESNLRTTGGRVGYMRFPAEFHCDIVDGSAVIADITIQDVPATEWSLTIKPWMLGASILGSLVAEFCAARLPGLAPRLTRVSVGLRAATEEMLITMAEPYLGRTGAGVAATMLDGLAFGTRGLVMKLLSHLCLSRLPPAARVVCHVALNLAGAACDFLVLPIIKWVVVGYFGCMLLAAAASLSLASWDATLKARKKAARSARSLGRWVGYGYRAEKFVGTINPSSTTKVRKHGNFEIAVPEKIFQYEIGPIFNGLALPMADTTDPETMLQGALHRVGSDPNPCSAAEAGNFFDFTQGEMRTLFRPGEMTHLNEEEWAVRARYSQERISAIMVTYDEWLRMFQPTDAECEGHGKRENYLMYKTGRVLCARSDRLKPRLGRIFKSIEGTVYELFNFIKHVPMSERVEYLKQMFDGQPEIYETDYTSFEGSFQLRIMQIECWIYAYMLAWDVESADFVKKVLCGTNTVRFKWFTLKMRAKRMSGEMNTSLGNGIMNYMLARYMGASSEHLIVEGDDALFCPRPGCTIDVSKAARLGFKLKIERRSSVLVSKFCGLMMSEDGISFTDPRKVLCTFGWSHSALASNVDKAAGLRRAKALSLMYEHPRCPILWMLAKTSEERTRSVDALMERSYYTDLLVSEMAESKVDFIGLNAVGPSTESRLDFSLAYGITIADQLEIEDDIRYSDVGYYYSPAIARLFEGDEWADVHDYSATYISQCGLP